MKTLAQIREEANEMTRKEMIELRDEIESNWNESLRPLIVALGLACINNFNCTLSNLEIEKETKEEQPQKTLNIAKVSNRGNKYAIVFKNSILRKFKTIEEAKRELEKNYSLYEYWSESVSVSIDNSNKYEIVI